MGSKTIPLGEVLDALRRDDGSDATAIVRDLRIPRTALGLLVGAALGVAGALMQGVTRNALGDPGILGINAGAALAVVLAISVLGVGSLSGYAAFALLGAALAAVALLALGATPRGGPSPVRLALAGAVLASLLVSLTSAVLVFDARTLDEFRFWIVGSIAGRDPSVAAALVPLALVGFALAALCARGLDALALGDDVARSLGRRVARDRVVACVAFVVLAGVAVAGAGPIAFVGLIVPHLARSAVGTSHARLLPASAVLGAALLVASDVAGRVVVRPAELEVGIVTAAAGAPFLIHVVRRRRLVAG